MAPNSTDGCIPGYQGYIPCLNHVYGKTYKSSTIAAHTVETKLREGHNSASWKNLEPSLQSCKIDTRPQNTGETFIQDVRSADRARASTSPRRTTFREAGATEGMARFRERQDFSRKASEKMGIDPWQTQYAAAHSPRRPTTTGRIPGYQGYVPCLKNHVFAQTFTESTRRAANLEWSPRKERPSGGRAAGGSGAGSSRGGSGAQTPTS